MSSVDGEPTGSRAEPDDEKVVLSSIHQAKGLEWEVVFWIWLADGMFPNGRILEADDQDMFEEERRLFYVALTRSKDELYLIYPQINPKSDSGDISTRPSRFLEDCPEEMLETWEVGPAW
jgi:DNA helicase-2/ATP-dependent DNA helicase PcrA